MQRGLRLWGLTLALGAGPACQPLPEPAAAPIQVATSTAWFEDVTGHSGIRGRNVCGGAAKDYIVEATGAGACWLDYDGDGWLDLYVVNGSTIDRELAEQDGEPNRLWRNVGDGSFDLVADAAGADHRSWGVGCVAGDWDNDGFTDLVVTNVGGVVLYRNRGDGRFQDVTAAAGVRSTAWSTGAALVDVNADGLLDLYVANYLKLDLTDLPGHGKLFDGQPLSCLWRGQPVFCGPLPLHAEHDALFQNLGDGRFADVSLSSGIALSKPRYGFAAVPFDFDLDGDVDIFVANDSVPNNLWQNDGTGHFVDVAMPLGVALAETGKAQSCMGADAQDYDGDGYIDLVFTNFDGEYNTILRNLAGRTFLDVSYATGLARYSLPNLSWGVGWVDFDNDADLDLFVVSGHVYPSTPGGAAQANQLLVNDGTRLVDRSDQAGLRATRVGRGAAFADFDQDGGVDVIVTNLDDEPTLLRNVAERGHWLAVDLTGTESNRPAYGARVTVRTSSRRSLLRSLHSGASFLSGNSRRLHFGLGDDEVEAVEVVWPSGRTSVVDEVERDRVLTIVESDLAGDGTAAELVATRRP